MPTKLIAYFDRDTTKTNFLTFNNVTCIKKNFNGNAQPISSIDELINYKGLLIITADTNLGNCDTILDLNFVNSISFLN